MVAATPGEAEIALTVAHGQHMRGVGTLLLLLQRLAATAKANGIHRLVADVLTSNHPMMRVLLDGGWPCRRERDGSVVNVVVDLLDIE